MNKLIFYLLVSVSLFIAAGCTNKFNIAAPYKNVTVIYAYLDANDTAHYVRILKAFLDNNKNSLAMAQAPDSSFYTNLNVMVKVLNIADTALIDTIHLNRVDLGNEGYPKQPGVFFTAPNYAYKFTNILNPNYLYRIIVTNHSTGQADSAETPVIDDRPGDIDPNTGKAYFTSSIFDFAAFADFGTRSGNFAFGCLYTSPPGFSFENYTSPAVAAQAVIRFNWLDSDFTTHTKTPRSFDFNAGITVLTPVANLTSIYFGISNGQLFDALAIGMGKAPPNTGRLIGNGTLFVYLGTNDFIRYETANLTQGVGITGDDVGPIFTNVKGPDALGLFSARAMRQSELVISDETIDSFELSQLTIANNVKGRVQ